MAIDPIRTSSQTESVATPVPTAPPTGFAAGKDSPFGPDYKLEEPLKHKPMRMDVPFGPDSAGATMASLPPMSPIGAGALTELSLQVMMDAGTEER